MMQRRLSITVRRVQGTLVLDQQVDHRRGSHGRGPVESVLAPLVTDSRGCGWRVVEESAGDVEVVLGGDEMDYCLWGG